MKILKNVEIKLIPDVTGLEFEKAEVKYVVGSSDDSELFKLKTIELELSQIDSSNANGLFESLKQSILDEEGIN